MGIEAKGMVQLLGEGLRLSPDTCAQEASPVEVPAPIQKWGSVTSMAPLPGCFEGIRYPDKEVPLDLLEPQSLHVNGSVGFACRGSWPFHGWRQGPTLSLWWNFMGESLQGDPSEMASSWPEILLQKGG